MQSCFVAAITHEQPECNENKGSGRHSKGLQLGCVSVLGELCVIQPAALKTSRTCGE